MRSIEDKGCLNNGNKQETSAGSCIGFEFQKSGWKNRTSHHRTALGKPTPSKWDDAQKWLVNLSRGEKNQAKASPRNSNADDRRLIAPVPKKDYSSGEEEGENGCDVETKNVDCDESVWRSNKPIDSPKPALRSICLRDMGTEMTPNASQGPSRATTPVRATTPASRSPVSSGSSTPVRSTNGGVAIDSGENTTAPCEKKDETDRPHGATRKSSRDGAEPFSESTSENKANDQSRKLNPLETRALAWDEAERAKYMARYKREEVKIQAWENHQIRKAEMENRKVEAKAERLKSRAQEKYNKKLAATRRIAEEKRANAESKLNEKGVEISERADYMKRSGHLPSSFSIKLPSFCW
ncbi:hypothetical protein Salat_1975800 [Sesamum alatum]|uniref:Remorin C-terminal domain-containing protein n=1 Tax=Sesamum alatum TaxID=300844 RepID=A0AAE1Y5Y0_9LAMI|nr:hypothetical protein Salat_1975800 [Sesamum alatum]